MKQHQRHQKLLLLMIFFLFYSFHAILPQGRANEISCEELISIYAKRNLKNFNHCQKELSKKPSDKSKMANCALRCVMKKERLLGPSGEIGFDQYDTFLIEQFPSHLRDHFNNTFRPCIPQEVTVFKAHEDDPYCKGIASFTKCFYVAAASFCKH